MAAVREVSDQEMLDKLRPRFPFFAVDQQFRNAVADSTGQRVVTQPFESIVARMRLLSATQQAHVVDMMQRGQPALVVRPSGPGEPAGGVPMTFYPVKLASP